MIFRGIEPIQSMTQAHSENIALNQPMTQRKTIRFESSHDSALRRTQVCSRELNLSPRWAVSNIFPAIMIILLGRGTQQCFRRRTKKFLLLLVPGANAGSVTAITHPFKLHATKMVILNVSNGWYLLRATFCVALETVENHRQVQVCSRDAIFNYRITGMPVIFSLPQIILR